MANAANEQEIKLKTARLALAQKQLTRDFQEILALPAGVRMLRWLMDVGCIFQTTFTGNSNGYFLEGKRNLALEVFTQVCMADRARIPDLIMREPMEEEGNERNSNRDADRDG